MILLGDCLERLKELEASSIDAVMTDPPYGLKFMGKKWDYDVPTIELWREVLRVIKPGGYLLSFGGTRTYHRMVLAIEDAGFEVRDQIQWLYGSGFPKSHNIGNGIGTALKPANEPIVLARKPLEKGLTVAQNVEKWGVGGLNIDASRIEGNKRHPGNYIANNDDRTSSNFGAIDRSQFDSSQGRWPANLILDETAAEMLGDPSRFFYVAKASKKERNAGIGEQINGHPTVKPIKLMEYLIKLITPPNGTVLDPFMGSGSTGIAAFRLGFKFIGIEMNEEYVEIATKRLEHASGE